MSEINIERLYKLNRLIQSGEAIKADKDEYMIILFRNNTISEKQYVDYKHGKYKEELFNMGLTLGSLILLDYLLSKLILKLPVK